MQNRFLIIDDDISQLLGYPLKLTPTEHTLLYAILQCGKANIDFLCSMLNDGVSRSNVAVHVNAINRKAYRLSGRKLVIFRKKAYEINEFM